MAKTPEVILQLVENFEQNIDSFKSQGYNETQLRREFIDPFFEALGWDIQNKAGIAAAYKDVIHEDAIKVGSATKAPDYCFRIGGTRKFFVETKKPAVDIKSDIDPAYQLRRYAWSAKLPLSILTDFEEFAVYDCQTRPKPDDKPSTARVLLLTYKDYVDKWGQIANIFSKEAVLKGSFDKFASEKTPKRGTTTVDKEFLAEIENWRDTLAKNIAIRNRRLSVYDLNFAVQATIDRILFLRMCEDRGIERYSQLQGLIGGDRIYPRLFQVFQRADEKYNSGLFYFRMEKDRQEPPDELSENLRIDDDVLKQILKELYYPQSPYEFSVLPAEILGQVYEQFLGKVIRLTPAHQAKVEEKPEVKKAGGVYYTPSYIVDYIVKNTVGKLCEDKTPKQIEKLKILDPACGSGSFLIGAYNYLLNYHRDYYVKDHSKYRKQIYQGKGGQWFLTIAEKKKILLNNIFGVDIDSQAVEVTKLSLLLKVLENETQESLRLFHERALPDLASNIKCGNSLIGPDFYQNRQLSLFDDDQQRKINAFDWQKEFPQIFTDKNQGFDAVIGNPPYIRVRIFKELYPDQVEYLETHYICATHVWDVYLLFFEKALSLTCKGGHFSFIVPIQTLHQPNCESLRKLLLHESSLARVVDLSSIRVFQDAIVKNCILVCQHGCQTRNVIETSYPSSPEELLGPPTGKWPQRAVKDNPGYSLKLNLLTPRKILCEKLKKQSWRLEELCYVTFGLRSCAKGKGQGGKDRLITIDGKDKKARPYLEGRDISRYEVRPTGRFIRYIPEEMYSPRMPALFEAEKIVSQSMLSRMRLIGTLDKAGYYVEQSLVCIIPHGIVTKQRPAASIPLEFILGILNSRLESFYFATYIIDYSLGGGLIHATPGTQGKLMIPRVSDAKMNPIVSLVDRMLELHKKVAGVKNPEEKVRLQRQIDSTDEQIDKLVYELYGLTEEEIRIVEEKNIEH